MKVLILGVTYLSSLAGYAGQDLKLNKDEYFETQGLNVIVLNDIYPEGHQGGITIIQHGVRVAANGNLFLTPTPGQWQPFPKLLSKEVNKEEEKIVALLKFPDSSRITTNDQPIIYPDLDLTFKLTVLAEGDKFRIIVDLEEPLPSEWIGKIGFNLELFPGDLFGKTYFIDNQWGIFPRYVNSPVEMDSE